MLSQSLAAVFPGLSIPLAIVGIAVLIVVHELGHFVAARLCKMRVERFSIGFGPALWTWPLRRLLGKEEVDGIDKAVEALRSLARQHPFNKVGFKNPDGKDLCLDSQLVLAKSDAELAEAIRSTFKGDPGTRTAEAWDQTDFTFAPILFGGFVQIDGMTLADEIDADDENAYPNKPLWQRALAIFAGPATNYLFAIFIACGLYIAAGIPTGTAFFEVGRVMDDSPAVGVLEPGDKLVKLNGEAIFYAKDRKAFTDLPKLVDENGTKALTLSLIRNGEELDVQVSPTLVKDDKGVEHYRMGIEFRSDRERAGVGVLVAVREAIYYPFRQTRGFLEGVWLMITRKVDADFGGPVKITQMIKDTIEVGWIRAIEFLMMLNVWLGFLNLFPLPALDGGRLVFLGYEMATRRRANRRLEQMVHGVGIMIILVLMVIITVGDIRGL
jgi:regulator of sigma E protease